MQLTGHTKPFAVLGHPIGHTLSPVMHNAAYAAMGWDAIYLAFDVAPDRLVPVLGAMRDMGFAGVNLTVPLKEVAFEGLSRLDESAQLLGAVNTVAFATDGLIGHNTDGYGFLRAVDEAFGFSTKGASVLVLGTGGAGRAVALVAAQSGSASITLADLDATRANKVAAEIGAAYPNVVASVATQPDELTSSSVAADLVVQATPVGMKPGDPALLEPAAFRKGQFYFDLIYHTPETPTMRAALAGGAQAANGLGMLLYQGARATTIWTGTEPPADVMRKALEEAVYGS